MARDVVAFYVLSSPLGVVVNPLVGLIIDALGFDVAALCCLVLGALMSVAQMLGHFRAACLAFVAYQVFLFTSTYS